MAAKFSAAERQAHILTVESLYLSGKTQADIAVHIGVSQQQISKYLVKLQKAWLDRLGEQLESAKGRELARLDRLEREYWEAWRRSCEPEETNVNKAKTTTVEAYTDEGLIEVPALQREWTHTQRGQAGDPRYLQGIQNCIEMRLKIVGGFAATKVDVTWRESLERNGVDPTTVFEQLVEAALARSTAADSGRGDGGSGTAP